MVNVLINLLDIPANCVQKEDKEEKEKNLNDILILTAITVMEINAKKFAYLAIVFLIFSVILFFFTSILSMPASYITLTFIVFSVFSLLSVSSLSLVSFRENCPQERIIKFLGLQLVDEKYSLDGETVTLSFKGSNIKFTLITVFGFLYFFPMYIFNCAFKKQYATRETYMTKVGCEK